MDYLRDATLHEVSLQRSWLYDAVISPAKLALQGKKDKTLLECSHKAEAQIVVAIARAIVAAKSHTATVIVEVPAAATKDAVRPTIWTLRIATWTTTII